KQKLFGYLLVLWGAYFIVSDAQDIFNLSLEPSSGYLGTVHTVVSIILSLIFLVIAVVLVLLARKVLGNTTETDLSKPKLLGHFLVLWSVAWIVNAILNVLPSSVYWRTATTVLGITVNLLFLPIAVVIVLLGRHVLGNKTNTETDLSKPKLLGYFLIFWGPWFFVSALQNAFSPGSFLHWETAYTVVSIILSLIFLAIAVVLVLFGGKVLGNKAGISAKQKLLGYFLVLWSVGWFFGVILNVLPSSGYWGTANLDLSIIADLSYFAT